MSKNLVELLKGLEYELVQGNINQQITNICYDSRKCKTQDLFVAVSGLVTDGHNYINQVVENGGKVIVLSKDIPLPYEVTAIKVADTRKALAIISANYYDNPSEKMKIVGITGTNGKTTTIHILKSVYEQAGYKVGLIGTIGATIGDKTIPCNNTTPESLDLQEILSRMVKENVEYCFVEVSSHALALDRVYGIKFYAGMFTNLSPDHLEFHKNMEDYYNTKKKLFYMTEKFNIINIDDPWGKKILEELKESSKEFFTFGINENADYKAENINYNSWGVRYNIVKDLLSREIVLKIPGKVNVYNSLTAISFALTDDIPYKTIFEGIKNIQGVRGRFENVFRNDDFQVIIDFAHTEDGLKEVITTLRPFTKGKIILVFGVYAPSIEEGRSKRLAMGKTAAEFADILFITSDNPKTQDQEAIIKEIKEGALSINLEREIFCYTDRKQAIEEAIIKAKKNDLVLITGKGHETAQIIGNIAVPFNEKEIVLNAVNKK